jgi:hypothetical protein
MYVMELKMQPVAEGSQDMWKGGYGIKLCRTICAVLVSFCQTWGKEWEGLGTYIQEHNGKRYLIQA